MNKLIIAGQAFLMACGILGILDVLFWNGKLGVFLSKYLSLTKLFT